MSPRAIDQHRVVEHQQLRVEQIGVVGAAAAAMRCLMCSICTRAWPAPRRGAPARRRCGARDAEPAGSRSRA
jgi:hypothetical protein